MIDFCALVLEHYAGELKRWPCKSNRASSLGYAVPELNGCVRRGVYERTHWQTKELPRPEVALIFEEGHRQERAVLRDLATVGVDVIEQQTAYEWAEYEITGHIDGKIIFEGTAVPLEIKSCAPHIWDSISDFESLRTRPWLRSYMAQITLYMLMQSCDAGIFLFKNKSTGMLKQLNVVLDYDLGEACIRAAEKINTHVKDGTLPDRCEDRQVCKDCPFRAVCLPDVQFGVPLKINEDPMFEDRFIRCMELKESADEYKREWEIVSGELKATAGAGDLNLLVGDYHITGKADKRGAFRAKIERT